MSCEELYDAAEEIRAKTPALERAVDQSRKQDKVKEQVAWWLFAPAAFFLEGNSVPIPVKSSFGGNRQVILILILFFWKYDIYCDGVAIQDFCHLRVDQLTVF